MLVSFLYPFNIRNNVAPFLWIFYKQLTELSKDNVVFIGSEEYFYDPGYFAEQNRYEVSQISADNNTYTVPNIQMIDEYDKYIISEEIFDEIRKKFNGSVNLIWKYLLLNRYEPLENELDKYLTKIINKHGKIDGVMTWCNCPSLNFVAKKHKIQVIHNEIGPLRQPDYSYMAYLDFSGVNGHTECEERYQKWNKELKINDNIPVLSRTKILTLLRGRNVEYQINDNNHFAAGIALQVEDDSNILAYSNGFDNFELIKLVMQDYDPEEILIRKHPHSFLSYDIEGCTIDKSQSSAEFIAKCRCIYTINSSVGLEAMLLGKKVKIVGDSPFSFISNNDGVEQEQMLSFAVLGYLIPYELLFDYEYFQWRISNPSESSIYTYNLSFLGGDDMLCDRLDIPVALKEKVKNKVEKEKLELLETNEKLHNQIKELLSQLECSDSARSMLESNIIELEKRNKELEKKICEINALRGINIVRKINSLCK